MDTYYSWKCTGQLSQGTLRLVLLEGRAGGLQSESTDFWETEKVTPNTCLCPSLSSGRIMLGTYVKQYALSVSGGIIPRAGGRQHISYNWSQKPQMPAALPFSLLPPQSRVWGVRLGQALGEMIVIFCIKWHP